MGRLTSRRDITAVDLAAGTRRRRRDAVAGEEPLELRAHGHTITVTMRTPGHDVELVHGFLLAEAVIRDAGDVLSARYCAGSVISDDTGQPENTFNVMEVALIPEAQARISQAVRNFATTSSCGVCGKASIDDVVARLPSAIAGDLVVSAPTLIGLPERMRPEQRIFASTGGIHAAALFDPGQDSLVVREDVGRHNAADKVIGEAVLAGKSLRSQVLVLSGRVSFELVQKAAMAGISLIVAVSAPSSLAVELADSLGITVVGFVRGQRCNIYTHPHRVS